MDFDASSQGYVKAAAALARLLDAQLRILYVIPEVDEGTLARSFDSSAPLSQDVTMRRLSLSFGVTLRPEVDFAVGSIPKHLPRMLKKCDADILVLGPGQALRNFWR